MSTHTPTPWTVTVAVTQDGLGGFTVLSLISSDGRTIMEKRIQGPSSEKNEADFELAAQAVNAHKILVRALRAIVARYQGEWDQPDLKAFGPLTVQTQGDMYDLAAEALAKAGL
jgi:hypothetical protein